MSDKIAAWIDEMIEQVGSVMTEEERRDLLLIHESADLMGSVLNSGTASPPEILGVGDRPLRAWMHVYGELLSAMQRLTGMRTEAELRQLAIVGGMVAGYGLAQRQQVTS